MEMELFRLGRQTPINRESSTMSRQKRSSKILEKAEVRAARLRSIDPTLNLGDGLTLAEFSQLIEQLRTRLADYNAALSSVDKVRNEVLDLERKLGDVTEHMLLGVATKFGKNSNEYEMAGGVRKDRRKRRTQSLVLKASPRTESVA